MIYAIKKFRHYLLGNNFVFYVDHQNIVVFGQQTNGNRLNCHMTFTSTRI
jgi:hypothetical protein